MHPGDRAIIKIGKMAFGGEGVGRIDNFVVFVPFTAPEDELEIEIVQCKKKFARGKILRIINPSPWRVKPLCRYYEKCGGCCYQQINYEEQLRIKREQVEDTFVRIAGIASPPVEMTIASPREYHYRGKAQCHQIIAGDDRKIGFLDVSGAEVIDISRCEIMDETINEKIDALRKKPAIRNRESSRLTIWSEFPGGRIDNQSGIKRLIREKEFLVPVDGFFQNNLFLTEILVEEVIRMALSEPANKVIDAYCGCGLFSIFLAPFAGEVLGIELNPKAVRVARLNAEKENITNIKLICGDVGEELFKQQNGPSASVVDLLLLDPPRVGCSELTFRAVARMKPKKIIYISCNPATQARDIKLFNEFGYHLVTLQPLDMFPQTQHIEVVALLQRR